MHRLLALGAAADDLSGDLAGDSPQARRDVLLSLTREVQQESVRWDPEAVARWLDALAVAAVADPLVLDAAEAHVQGPGWYPCWLRFAIALVSAESASVDLRSGLAVEAIGLLTGDLRPFAGKPRACDLYAIHPLIQGTVRRAVVHVSDDDWPQAWETLTHVSRGISTTLRGELGGPLPADLLLSIAVEQATPARRASVDEAIHSEFEQQAGGRYYSDLARYLRQALPAISPHTLTSRLRQFETYGIVTRTTYAEIPPRVEYQLTPLSEGLRDVLDAMATWADSVPFPEDTKLVRKLSDL